MDNEAQLEIFRHNIRILRHDRKLSKKYTARHLGISVTSLTKLESFDAFPNIPISAILRAAALFDIPAPILLSCKL